MTKILMMKKMYTYNIAFLLLTLFSFCIHAQDKNNTKPPDTTNTISDIGSTWKLNNVINSFSPVDKKFFFTPPSSFPLDSTSILLRTRMQLAERINDDPIKTNFNSSILNPLRQSYAESQSMKELKYILGVVQAGAVGYIAYQHLKKYGFLKRK